jgi:hypothetical protein
LRKKEQPTRREEEARRRVNMGELRERSGTFLMLLGETRRERKREREPYGFSMGNANLD